MADIVASRAILCSCTVGYVYSCAFSPKNARDVNRSYVSERVVKKRRPASALMLKRLSPDLTEPVNIGSCECQETVMQWHVFENVVKGYASAAQ